MQSIAPCSHLCLPVPCPLHGGPTLHPARHDTDLRHETATPRPPSLPGRKLTALAARRLTARPIRPSPLTYHLVFHGESRTYRLGCPRSRCPPASPLIWCSVSGSLAASDCRPCCCCFSCASVGVLLASSSRRTNLQPSRKRSEADGSKKKWLWR